MHFVLHTHALLGSPPPECAAFEIDPEKAATVEMAALAFLKSKRLPVTTA
jgi:hypothetical protein